MLYLAFLTGFLGSLHCIGMCGALVLALPKTASVSWWYMLGTRLVYHSGRVAMYASLGILIGFIGQGITIPISQQWLSIGVGIMMLFFLISPFSVHLFQHKFLYPLYWLHQQVKKQAAYWLQKRSYVAFLAMGLLNGILPCGLVYLALAAALAQGDALMGAVYMAVFGLGTIPAMLSLSLLGKMFQWRIQFAWQPVLTLLLAVVFILRGLDLGIPYLSPKINLEKQGQKVECCSKKKN
ncbi:MAG: sulfite exporter TauE/SafE family protein [Cytophagales bacterium]|nr:MAG: sulfite exporter TauE/SafE family protein [Cytophagales bacterium]